MRFTRQFFTVNYDTIYVFAYFAILVFKACNNVLPLRKIARCKHTDNKIFIATWQYKTIKRRDKSTCQATYQTNTPIKISNKTDKKIRTLY
jgi:hypothetical protein